MTWKRAVFALFAVAAGHERADAAAARLPGAAGPVRRGAHRPVRLLRRRTGAGPAARRAALRPARPPPGRDPRDRALGAWRHSPSPRPATRSRCCSPRASCRASSAASSSASAAPGWASCPLASGEGAGGRRAAFAMTAGFSLGPLTSGLLGEFGPGAHRAALPAARRARRRRAACIALGLPETVDLTPPTERRRDAPPGPGAADPQRRRPAVRSRCSRRWPSASTPSRRRSSPRCRCWSTCPTAGWPSPGSWPASRSAPARWWPPLQRTLGPWTAVRRRRLGAAGFAAATAFATTGGCPGSVVTAPLLGVGRWALPRRRAHADRPARRTDAARRADGAVPRLRLPRVRGPVRAWPWWPAPRRPPTAAGGGRRLTGSLALRLLPVARRRRL